MSQVKANQLISVLFSLTFLLCLVSAVCSKHPYSTEKGDMICIPACLYLEAGAEDLVFCWAPEGHSKVCMPFLVQNKVTLF